MAFYLLLLPYLEVLSRINSRLWTRTRVNSFGTRTPLLAFSKFFVGVFICSWNRNSFNPIIHSSLPSTSARFLGSAWDPSLRLRPRYFFPSSHQHSLRDLSPPPPLRKLFPFASLSRCNGTHTFIVTFPNHVQCNAVEVFVLA